MAAAGALALTGCASTDDALLKAVSVGSGTSTLALYDFTKCVKTNGHSLDARVREYSLSSDTQATSVPSKDIASQSVMLAVAQQLASGTDSPYHIWRRPRGEPLRRGHAPRATEPA
ncbi:hypothetical protein BPMI_00376 [Candidatus Burkholderia pumila]|uniref:Uncharacterized protein n=1 Tax=Candidatus Burkholderia pumila TaxID=1090375 RepID=A0ABR5HNA9_9BURK|nr:hypothetical protein BPMI_00376 [Candidatus Burkholderia pumila]